MSKLITQLVKVLAHIHRPRNFVRYQVAEHYFVVVVEDVKSYHVYYKHLQHELI